MKSRNKCVVLQAFLTVFNVFAMDRAEVEIPLSQEPGRKAILQFNYGVIKRILGVYSPSDSTMSPRKLVEESSSIDLQKILSYSSIDLQSKLQLQEVLDKKQERNDEFIFTAQNMQFIPIKRCGFIRYFWTIPTEKSITETCKIIDPIVTKIVRIIGKFTDYTKKDDTIDIYLGFNDISERSFGENDVKNNPIFSARILNVVPHFSCIEQHITKDCPGPKINMISSARELDWSDMLGELGRFLSSEYGGASSKEKLQLEDVALQNLLGEDYRNFDKETKRLKVFE